MLCHPGPSASNKAGEARTLPCWAQARVPPARGDFKSGRIGGPWKFRVCFLNTQQRALGAVGPSGKPGVIQCLRSSGVCQRLDAACIEGQRKAWEDTADVLRHCGRAESLHLPRRNPQPSRGEGPGMSHWAMGLSGKLSQLLLSGG